MKKGVLFNLGICGCGISHFFFYDPRLYFHMYMDLFAYPFTWEALGVFFKYKTNGRMWQIIIKSALTSSYGDEFDQWVLFGFSLGLYTFI